MKQAITLICYADHNMITSQRLCIKSAHEKGGIQVAQDFDPDFIEADSDFFMRNEEILRAQQRGGGYGFWLWKPYICELSARSLLKNSYVVYADAGVEFINSLQPIIEHMEETGQEIFLFGNGHTHIEWCKKKVFEAMLPGWWNLPYFENVEQVQASVIVFKISDFTRRFMREWLAWSEIPGFIDDSDNVGIMRDCYRDHRNDQAILTNLAIRHEITLHWWPAQYGHVLRHKYPADNFYGQLFYHHRYRESDWQNKGITIEQFQAEPKNI